MVLFHFRGGCRDLLRGGVFVWLFREERRREGDFWKRREENERFWLWRRPLEIFLERWPAA